MLTDTKVRQAKSTEKSYKIYDADGLYIEIAPTGAKKWRWKYRWQGKEKRLGLGIYPDVSLKLAREKRDALRKQLASGEDPSLIRKKERIAKSEGSNTFQYMAEEWFLEYSNVWSASHQQTTRKRLDTYLLPEIGDKLMGDITPFIILDFLKRLEKRGLLETANRLLGICSMVFRRAVALGKVQSNPCRDLKGALAPARAKHHAALTTKDGARSVMRSIEAYQGSASVRAAVRFTALTFVRQQELRFAKWDEILWEDAMWLIPAERMKGRREHIVPLSRQAIKILHDLLPLTGSKTYIFVGSKGTPISVNTVRCALRSMGFSNDEMTAHGFRSMASTLLNEMGFRSDVIERQLAHVEGNTVRAAYNRAEYLTERREMMQKWADFLDSLL